MDAAAETLWNDRPGRRDAAWRHALLRPIGAAHSGA